jgi:hypothetical protein
LQRLPRNNGDQEQDPGRWKRLRVSGDHRYAAADERVSTIAERRVLDIQGCRGGLFFVRSSVFLARLTIRPVGTVHDVKNPTRAKNAIR